MSRRIQQDPFFDGSCAGAFVRLENVSVRYAVGDSTVTALSALELHLAAGELAVVCGGPGSGKTTLVELICAVKRPSSGRVVVGGVNLDALDDRARLEFRATRLAVIPERPFLAPSRSPRETLIETAALAGASAPEESAYELLAAIGLGHVLDIPAGSLAPEDKQCLSIARALAKDSPLLVADDPIHGLDSARAERVVSTVYAASRSRAKTVILICSGRGPFRTADQIIELDEPGRAAER